MSSAYTDVGSDDLQAELARRVRAARALSGKKARELALELGWSPAKLYRAERGEQVLDALELAAYAHATGQEVGFFFGASLDRPAEGPTLPLLPDTVKAEGDAAGGGSREVAEVERRAS